MKFKLKLDKDSLQQFLLENAEKFVFGLVALGALYIISQALTHKGYEKTPQQLLEKSKQADEKIDRTPGMPPADCRSVEFEKLVRRILLPIDEGGYVCKNSWDVPVVNPLRLRPQPQLYAAEKLRGAAGEGKFAVQSVEGANAGRGQHGMRYVLLTALVPLEQQTASYQDAFEGARYQDPQLDGAPSYLGFYVQRAVAPASGQDPELHWEKPIVSVTAINDAKEQWQGTSPEVVDQRFLYGRPVGRASRDLHNIEGGGGNPLVCPLGPSMDHGWGAEAAHEPEIPLMQKTEPRGRPREQPIENRHPATDGFETEEPSPEKEQPQTQPEEDTSKAPKYVLLRFFDLTAKPGVSYRYRVSLVLKNPNYEVAAAYLANADFHKDKTIQSPWSEPSNTMTVPKDVRVLVKSVSPPKTPAGEPEGKVVVLAWQEDTGDTAHAEFPGKRGQSQQQIIVRGKILNFPDAEVERKSADAHPSLDRGSHGHQPHARAEKKDFLSDAVVVDMIGDGPSGEMLLLDKDGNLVAHHAAEDTAAYEQWEKAEEAAAAQGPLLGPSRFGPRRRPFGHRDLDEFNQPKGPAARTNNKNKS